MNQELLWKLELLCMRSRWKLLCIEFEDAKKNYITIFTPVLKNIREKITATDVDTDTDDIFLQMEKAETVWKEWVEIQIKLKKFIEEDTRMDSLKSTHLI